MMNYGVAQSRDQQMQLRKSATFKMAIVIAVLAFLGWLTGRLYFDVNTPVWILIAGSLFVLFLYYASVMSDMRKINDENIGYLLHYGKENQMLVDTINASLERNGCISRFDLKSIQYEIWAHNHDLKSDLENPNKTADSSGISGWGVYHFNETLITKIDRILGK